MDKELIKMVIELAITIAAFLIGRYILPKIKVNLHNAGAQFSILLNYAESFCAYARQFLTCSGPEKMDDVVKKLKAICEQYGITVDDETLRAIGQKAYDAMVAGENSSKVIIENALEEIRTFPPLEEIRTFPPLEENTADKIEAIDTEKIEDSDDTN